MSLGVQELHDKLLTWYETNKRDLPWRTTKDPYLIWLSEVILQQTRVDQGLPYYLKFKKAFPSVFDFDQATEDTILSMWEGLGYYSRARNMRKTARVVAEKHHGKFPNNYDDLLLLPGIGPYSAAAISSICFGQPMAVVDGNVIRVLSRLFGIVDDPRSSKGKKIFFNKAQKLINKENPGNYNQALMEFGALHCTPKLPKCVSCIFQKSCRARKRNKQNVWPVRSTKKARIKRHLHYYVCISGTDIILQKRGNQDIYKGLYQLPLIEQDRQPSLRIAQNKLKIQGIIGVDNIKNLDMPMTQTLSHQEIHANFYRIDSEWSWQNQQNGYIRIPLKKLSKFAMPRILRRFLSNFDLH